MPAPTKKNSQHEEILILEQILKILPKDLSKSPRILFAPRHPERFHSIAILLNQTLKAHKLPPLAIASKSNIQETINAPFGLIDTLGELNNLYSISSLVILGGSFLPNIGGHNPIEPAFFGVKLISGPYIFNQKIAFYGFTKLHNQ